MLWSKRAGGPGYSEDTASAGQVGLKLPVGFPSLLAHSRLAGVLQTHHILPVISVPWSKL